MGTCAGTSRDWTMNKILNFRLRGKMAHFRRYYSNSSALTYSIPPRTTIIGIIAGLLGFERDSYYEYFSPDQCRVAVGIRSPQKKKFETLSLLMIKSTNDLNGSQTFHSQTPTELIIPAQIRTQHLDYEIWFSHKDACLMDKLCEQVLVSYSYLTQGIAVALGTAPHLGWIDHGTLLEGKEAERISEYVHSVIPLTAIDQLNLANHKYDLHLQKENMPVHFHSDRTLARKEDFIINASGFPVHATVHKAVRLNDGRVITWMEG